MDCESCVNYVFDDNEECYTCLAEFDEDETADFLNGGSCPYFRLDDEYGVVKKQM